MDPEKFEELTGRFSGEEKKIIETALLQMQEAEINQSQDLIQNCNNKFQFAKTYSTYIEDWEKTKRGFEELISKNIFPEGMSKKLVEAILEGSEEIIQGKLRVVSTVFQMKFGESIFNYLGPDGKRKKLFGIF